LSFLHSPPDDGSVLIELRAAVRGISEVCRLAAPTNSRKIENVLALLELKPKGLDRMYANEAENTFSLVLCI
jgi:hypothetical protein